MFTSIYYFLYSFFFVRKQVIYTTEVVRVEVLSQNAFNRLARQLEPPVVSASDTAHTTGFKLGIQRTLAQIQKDFTQG
jgi:hypothetical protein